MTIDKDQKRRIRERAAKTGEKYVVARMHELKLATARFRAPAKMEGTLDLTEQDREELAALWLEIGIKRLRIPAEIWSEPFVYGIVVDSITKNWPEGKPVWDDLDSRLKTLSARLVSQGETAVREWIAARDRAVGDEAASYTPADEALVEAWFGLRAVMAADGFIVAPAAPLFPHELAEFGDPRVWRQNRPVLARMRRLVAERGVSLEKDESAVLG